MSTFALPGPYKLTFQDWMRFPDDGRLYEIIRGELYMTPPPAIRHQRISRELEFRILAFLRSTGLGEVLDAPVGVRLSDDTVLEPDLLVVLTENASRIGEQVVNGPPDIVVEILSPGSARRDLGLKRTEYEAAGVREYWIVDPETRSVEVLALEKNTEQYARDGLYRIADSLTSRLLPGLSIALGEIFPD